MPVRIEHWQKDWGPLSEGAMRKRLEAEGYSVRRYTYPPGTYFSAHTHEVDKKDAVLRGRLKIGAEGREFVLEAGDMIEIPAGTVHTAEVIGEEAVTSLDATCAPARGR
ncbi:MAG TPA: cupin domain-containing protein [Candidatus Xenobia bacterium]|nr:cupin domain-containing protein [Candidatus Xenobia bacterium]